MTQAPNEAKTKIILDACCGGRMFWFNKHHPRVVYQDIRIHNKGENKHRPNFTVLPDVIADFRKMPYPDRSFKLVVFDPPHVTNAPKGSVIGDYYGQLDKKSWKKDILEGFNECWRVLENYGVLIVKWNETQIKRGELLEVIGKEPLFGNRPGGRTEKGTHWLCYMKIEE